MRSTVAPLESDHRNDGGIRFDEAHRDVVVTCAIGDSRSQRVGGLEFGDGDDVLEAPGRPALPAGSTPQPRPRLSRSHRPRGAGCPRPRRSRRRGCRSRSHRDEWWRPRPSSPRRAPSARSVDVIDRPSTRSMDMPPICLSVGSETTAAGKRCAGTAVAGGRREGIPTRPALRRRCRNFVR